MTREEAIYTLIKRIRPCVTANWGEAVDMAIEALEENESLAKSLNDAVELIHKLKKNEWIPVSDRLPDKDFTDFLVQIGHGKYAVYETAYRVRGRWVFYSDRKDGEGQSVIAWMECPEPYKENES